MRIGILSDSHGRAPITGQAVKALLDCGAEMLLHLGDIETETVIDELVGHQARIVFGNCDWNEQALASYARQMGVEVNHPAGRLEIEGKTIVFTHGHIDSIMQEALAEGVDYLFHGHSHELRDERMGRTRIINPGALFRATAYTAALLEPACDHLQIVKVAPVR